MTFTAEIEAEYVGIKGLPIPRKTADFLICLRDKVHNHANSQGGMNQEAHRRAFPDAKVGITLEEGVLNWIKHSELYNYNLTAGENWKGVKRNTPWPLICGSGSSHIWISRADTKERVMLITW